MVYVYLYVKLYADITYKIKIKLETRSVVGGWLRGFVSVSVRRVSFVLGVAVKGPRVVILL